MTRHPTVDEISPKLGALRELQRLGGIGHLQDIRYGAYGTKHRRIKGGRDVQALAYELEKRGFIRKAQYDKYFLTEAGRQFIAGEDNFASVKRQGT